MRKKLRRDRVRIQEAEEEMVVLAENNLLYNATVEVLKRRLGMLEYAASDGGR